MNNYRFILDKGSKKYSCPDCGKKTLVAYIDAITGDYLPEQYGRCDREIKCSYHLNPYRDGYDAMQKDRGKTESSVAWKSKRPGISSSLSTMPEPVFIPRDIFEKTLRGYEQNVFIQNLLGKVPFPFAPKDIEQVIAHYHLGTICNGYRTGSISFPFIDKGGNIRTIQVKQFDYKNHTTGTDFLHSIIEKHYNQGNEPLPDWLQAYNRNETKVSCLFGERLLDKYPLNPIALVEAPKTAVYGTLYFGFPEQRENLLWLAVYNLSSLRIEKCKVLRGRDVFLFPDLSKDGKAFQDWTIKAKQFSEMMPGTRFEVSDLLETLAPNALKESGADIADILIQLDWRKFRPQQMELTANADLPAPRSTLVESENCEKSEDRKQNKFSQSKVFPNGETASVVQPIHWDEEIIELEKYFEAVKLPTQKIKLNLCSTITNVSLFIENHFATVKAHNGKKGFLPYLNRLKELKQCLTTNST